MNNKEKDFDVYQVCLINSVVLDLSENEEMCKQCYGTRHI